MNNEKYEELILRFAKELHDVGVTDDMKKRVQDSYERTPNIAGISVNDVIKKVYYHHDGYAIEAKCTVELSVKTAK
jgi:uncharacterized radical SAM superfamily Fe-S cluster-containing enzyme